MRYYCEKCDLELSIKKRAYYQCPLCNREIHYVDNNELEEIRTRKDNINISDEEKKEKLKVYQEKIDELKIKELLGKEKNLEEKLSKIGKFELLDYIKSFYKVLKDPSVEWINKVIAGGALLYVVTPIDLIPDAIIGAGFLDDAAMAGLAMKMLADAIRKYGESSDLEKVTRVYRKEQQDEKVIFFKFKDDDREIQYNYKEKGKEGLLILNKSDLKKFGLTINENNFIADEEIYVRHPYFWRTLIEKSKYSDTIMKGIWNERLKIIQALGAKKVSWKVTHLQHESKKGIVDMKLVGKCANIDGTLTNKKYSIRQEENYEEYNDTDIIDEDVINELIWVFTGQNEFKEIFRKRIMSGLQTLKVTVEDKSDEFADFDFNVNIAAKGTGLLNYNKVRAIYRKTEYEIEFHEIPEHIGNNRKESFEKIQERLEKRREDLVQRKYTVEDRRAQ